jgi:hypothetical protein
MSKSEAREKSWRSGRGLTLARKEQGNTKIVITVHSIQSVIRIQRPPEFETGSLSTIEGSTVIEFPPRPLNRQNLKQIMMSVRFINPNDLNMASCLTWLY